MKTTCRCGATWAGKRIEHCTACHETFTGTTAGDAHRTGPFADRRCLTPDEMAAKGLGRNVRGHWGSAGGSPWARSTESEPAFGAVTAEQPESGNLDAGDLAGLSEAPEAEPLSGDSCVDCGGPIDRVLPDPIPEGYECMWSEAMSGSALYCQACYGEPPIEGRACTADLCANSAAPCETRPCWVVEG